MNCYATINICANLYILLKELIEAQCQDNGTKLLSFVNKYQRNKKLHEQKQRIAFYERYYHFLDFVT